MLNTTTTKAVDSNVKVSLPVTRVVIERNITSETIAREISSRIMGKLIGFDDLFDVKTNSFLTESELKAKGAVFVTVSLDKVLVIGKDTVKKSRSNKDIQTPFIRKTNTIQYIVNVNWESFINKRGNGDFTANLERANGVTNVNNCKAVGETSKGFNTLNGVAFKVLKSTEYYNVQGDLFDDQTKLVSDFLNTQSKASKQKEADKHGIAVEFDPKYRTTRIDSCNSIKVFGFDYKPTENNSE